MLCKHLLGLFYLTRDASFVQSNIKQPSIKRCDFFYKKKSVLKCKHCQSLRCSNSSCLVQSPKLYCWTNTERFTSLLTSYMPSSSWKLRQPIDNGAFSGNACRKCKHSANTEAGFMSHPRASPPRHRHCVSSMKGALHCVILQEYKTLCRCSLLSGLFAFIPQ